MSWAACLCCGKRESSWVDACLTPWQHKDVYLCFYALACSTSRQHVDVCFYVSKHKQDIVTMRPGKHIQGGANTSQVGFITLACCDMSVIRAHAEADVHRGRQPMWGERAGTR
eukprot:1161401-Pelagomonas_calceolata.AAC.6